MSVTKSSVTKCLEGNTKPLGPSRVWCWTSFEKPDETREVSKIKFEIYQVEKAPETGRIHYQGFTQFNSAQRLEAVKKIYKNNTMHLEICRDIEASIKYCSKEETRIDGPFVFGTPPKGQGCRSDLETVTKLIKEKKTVKEICNKETSTYIKYHQGIEKAIFHHTEPRSFKTKVIVFWGASGAGKTRRAFEEFKDIYTKPVGNWWDGYDSQETTLIDDYDGYINFRDFLQLTDRYPYSVPIKGGYRQFVSKNIVITSNIDPKLWYPSLCEESRKAIMRRIDEIHYLDVGAEATSDA